MTNVNDLALIILYDPRLEEYEVVEHNLASADATAHVVALRKQSLPAFTVVQRTRHEAANPKTCATCQLDVKLSFAAWRNPRQKEETVMGPERKREPQAAEKTFPAPHPQASSARKPWIKKTPVDIVLAQITKQEEKVAAMREELKREERELQKLQQAKKVLEAT